jgi:ATPase subunit of ABC transporter with duplicated ATPase domains
MFFSTLLEEVAKTQIGKAISYHCGIILLVTHEEEFIKNVEETFLKFVVFLELRMWRRKTRAL